MGAPARARGAAGVNLWAEAWSLDARAGTVSVPRPRVAPAPRPRVSPAPRPALEPSPGSIPGSPARRRPSKRRSTSPAPARGARAARPAARPRTASRRSLIPLGLVMLALASLLLAPLLLNVASMRAEWQVSQLQTREDDLAAERSSLRAKVAALSSTQRIAEQASSLGLEPADPVDYLFLGQASPLAAGEATGGDGPTSGG